MSDGRIWDKLLKVFWGSFQRDARDLSKASERGGYQEPSCLPQPPVHTESLDFRHQLLCASSMPNHFLLFTEDDENMPNLLERSAEASLRVSPSPKQYQCHDYPKSCRRLKHITYMESL